MKGKSEKKMPKKKFEGTDEKEKRAPKADNLKKKGMKKGKDCKY